MLDAVERTARRLTIPLTVGGGVRSVVDVAQTLRSGADKVALNTAAVDQRTLVSDATRRFGAQCIVVSVDAFGLGDKWMVATHGGRQRRSLDAVQWAVQAVALGAGELLVTSIDRDGTRCGYDNALLRTIVERVSVPVIASGGAGNAQHLVDAFNVGQADAVLVAGILHHRPPRCRRSSRTSQNAAFPCASRNPMAAIDWLDALTTVFQHTAAVAMRFYRTDLTVETKADGSPVTVADRQAEQAARDWITKYFPNDSIVGEELGSNIHSSSQRSWCIDPIDGTESFIRGVPLWGTMVGVTQRDVPIASAVCVLQRVSWSLRRRHSVAGTTGRVARCRASTISLTLRS